MTIQAFPATADPPMTTRLLRGPWALLALGAPLSLLAVGGRWDVALAAWLAPILLLRFGRTMPALSGLAVLTLLSVAQSFWMLVQFGVALQPGLLALVVAMGLFFVLPFVADRLLAPHLGPVGRLLVFPAAIVAIEFAIAVLSPTGGSYGLRAITQGEALPVLQVMALAGPHAIGFLVGLVATAANALWEAPADSLARRHALAVAGLLVAVVAGGEARLTFLGTPVGAPHVRVAGITPDLGLRHQVNAPVMAVGNQGAVLPPPDDAVQAMRTPQMLERIAQVQDQMLAATRRAAQAGAQLVLWSETAVAVHAADRDALIARAAQVAREEGIYLNVTLGIPFARNEALLIGPDGQTLWSYDKNHPVPGMEPVPAVANAVPVAATPFGSLANVICYDADFPALARVAADILLVPGWDWPEVGASHTLKMARLRSVENGYALVRTDFDGQSAAFDRLGRTLASQDTTGPGAHVMVADVQVEGARTLYNRTGEVLGWACLAGLLAAAGLALRNRSSLRVQR
ncbi:nitrilase-related carbon-nitrogen hydrolase [Zavarzinia sp. CC-PAN008]|uniref:nitrilase-related carbon-nitrogen hydrolase n=1 Tax=Zavarzinia sp. CC-PAN008 TaxID=3243332 RepID=UPI003F744094